MDLRTAFNTMERHGMAFDNELDDAWAALSVALVKAQLIPRLLQGDRVRYDGKLAEELQGHKGRVVESPGRSDVMIVHFDGFEKPHYVEQSGVHLSC